jgi:hypothetical protein
MINEPTQFRARRCCLFASESKGESMKSISLTTKMITGFALVALITLTVGFVG